MSFSPCIKIYDSHHLKFDTFFIAKDLKPDTTIIIIIMTMEQP